MRMFRGAFAASAICVNLMLSLGCDKSPSGSTEKSPSPAAQSSAKPADAAAKDAAPTTNVSARDLEAIRAISGKKAEAPAATETPALPPGHPPLPPPPPPSGNLPPGHPPLPAAGAPSAPADSGAAELKFEAPADWKPTPPRSAMRKAQYAIPRAASDAEDGEVIVFFFGPGQGGGVADNLTRWKGQFKTPEGGPLPADAAREETLDAGGMKVTLLEVAGRFDPGAMPGMGAAGPKDGYRMIAGVVETPNGMWFVKATGPDATMVAQRDAVKKFLTSAKR